MHRPAGGDAVRADRELAELTSDDLYWLRITPAERVKLTWELSCELYALAARNGGVYDEESRTFVKVEEGDLERRLPRAAFRITRR